MKFSGLVPLLVLLYSTVVFALDDSQIWGWRAAHDLPLHWDNIENTSRQWIAGVRPEYDRDIKLHAIELKAGEHSLVAVPDGQWLQLLSLNGKLDSSDLTVARSIDGRLFVPEKVQSSKNPRALVTTDLHTEMGWVRIEQSARHDQPLRLALFVSRAPATGKVVTYPYELGIDKGAEAVKLSDRPGSQTHWHVLANRDAVMQVKGPQRIKLRSRLVLEPHTRSSDEAYRIEARLDSGEYQVLELETSDERKNAVQIDACIVPTGRLQYAYIEIPPGDHQLSLRPSRALYLQLTGSRDDGDYLFGSNAAAPFLNDPPDNAKASIWSELGSSLQRLFTSSTGIPDSERMAQRLARDNHWQAANLLAAHGLAGPPDYSFEALSRFRLAQRRAGTLQHYVDVLPNVVSGSFRQRAFRFNRVTLVERKQPQLIWKQQVPALAGNIASGGFLQLPLDSQQALQYRLPDRDYDSQLRLIVSAAPNIEKAALYIQFDNEPVQTVLLDGQLRSARSAVLRPDRATLAAALIGETGINGHSSGAILPWGEIRLPARVSHIRMWAGENELWAAVQLQKPASYHPGEGAYTAAVDAVGREKAAQRFIAMLREPAQSDLRYQALNKTAAEAELDNAWLPLLRYLHVQARYFSATAEDISDDEKPVTVDPAAAGDYRLRAEQAENTGDWVLAVEYWSYALHKVHGDSRQALRLRRALALRAGGETALASRELWRLYRDSASQAVRDEALSELLSTGNSAQETERGIRIMSAALLLRPDMDLLEKLLPMLIAAGRFNETLQLALLLPESPFVRNVLLQAARGESWWTVFERARMQLPDGDVKRYWSAWPAVAAGDYSRALEIWADAGNAGGAASERLQQALDIRKSFSEYDQDKRYQALLSWEQWQADSIEKTLWRSAKESIRGYAGSATVVIPQLGVNLQRYLATPSQGIELAVYGPSRLRISLRPLYPQSQVLPEDDWLTITMDDHQRYFAVNNNAPDPERHLAEDGAVRVGQRDQFIIDIPPGYHRLQLKLHDHDALFGIDLAKPAVFSEVLPMLTPEYVALLMAGPVRSDVLPFAGLEWPVRLAEACEISSVKVTILASNVDKQPDADVFNKLSELRAPSEYTRQEDPVRALAALVWQAERDPAHLAEIAASARKVYTALPADAEAQALMRRLQRRMSWKPVTNLWQRAGVRDITLNKAGPEHPPARIRHALLPALEDQEERISGAGALVFSLEQPYPVDFDFGFTLEGLLGMPTAVIRVAIKIDNQTERILRLGPQHLNVSHRKTIAPGAHSVRIRLLDPVARHSVRVRVRERQKDNSWVWRALRPAVRSYDVATIREPLTLYAHGPGLIRIDEWRGDHVAYRYSSVESGWQKLSFGVPPGQDEALYRVFQWLADTPAPSLPIRLPETLLPDLPVAPVFNAYPDPEAPVLQNQLQLAEQEDGTLSAKLELASRRNLDEDRDTGAAAEHFVEMRATHRKYLAHWQGYNRFDALTRIREDGGPTLGLREFLTIPTDWHDVEVDLNGSFYLQRPGAEAGTEWLGDLRARALQRRDLTARSYHRPSLRLFRRWMSLNDDLGEDPERVDQDVFTTYKKQHRQGLGLADDLFYRPFNDMVSWLGVDVTSNDDFNVIDPDYVRGKIGARLLWRDWDFGAEYAATQYFEDDDRASNQTRERVRLEAQMWRWSTPRNGLQLRFRFDHDRSSNDNSAWLSLSWHRANGRLFRDFRPGDLNFRGLRERVSNERLFKSDSRLQP